MTHKDLRTTVNLAVLVALSLLATVFGALLYLNEMQRLEASIRDVETLCATIYEQKRSNLANELFSEQREALVMTLRDIGMLQDVHSISVYDRDGRLFQTTDTEHGVSSEMAPELREKLDAGPVFERLYAHDRSTLLFATRIETLGEQVGFFQLHYDLSRIERESHGNIVLFIILLLALALSSSAILNRLLGRLVLQPVSQLRGVMHEVREGRLGLQVKLSAGNEIGEMAAAFNDMSARLKLNQDEILRIVQEKDTAVRELEESNQELERLNLELEARVKARTTELEESNAELTRHLSELSRRNREIEALNRMGELLQACQSQEEAQQVILRSTLELFPESGGIFSVMDGVEDQNVVACWDKPPCPQIFDVKSCKALRQRRMYALPRGERPVCDLASGYDLSGYFCAPLMAHGELLGLLHIQPKWKGLTDEEADRLFRAQERMLLAMSEHAALALANIKLRETLLDLSIRDPLTGLYNRRFMEESLHRELQRSRRRNTPLGIIMLDIDHFKVFNDTHGHDAGDLLLQALGDYLGKHIRSEDIACRYGGEEFTLILPEASLEFTARRAEDLRVGVERELRVVLEGQLLGKTTISAGVACYPEHGATSRQILRMADQALYLAKNRGRNRTVIHGAGD